MDITTSEQLTFSICFLGKSFAGRVSLLISSLYSLNLISNMDFQETLEHLDNNNGEKSQYMQLILDILHSNGTSKEDTETIQNAIYSYNSSK